MLTVSGTWAGTARGWPPIVPINDIAVTNKYKIQVDSDFLGIEMTQ